MKFNELNPFMLFNPLRSITFQYNEGSTGRFVAKVPDERFSSRRDKEAANNPMTKCNSPVIDLAFDIYHEEDGAYNDIDATSLSLGE